MQAVQLELEYVIKELKIIEKRKENECFAVSQNI